jgi:hypothetical protein
MRFSAMMNATVWVRNSTPAMTDVLLVGVMAVLRGVLGCREDSFAGSCVTH